MERRGDYLPNLPGKRKRKMKNKMKFFFLGFGCALILFVVSTIVANSIVKKNRAAAYQIMAETLYKEHRYFEAMRDISISIFNDPTRYSSHILLAKIYEELGEEHKAREEYYRAIAIIDKMKKNEIIIHDKDVILKALKELEKKSPSTSTE